MPLHGLSLLAGKTGQIGGISFRATNPSTRELLDPAFHEASATEASTTLDASAAAFANYRARSGADRAKFLEAIASEIEALGDTLLQRAHLETGLPLTRLTGERSRTCEQLRLFAQVAREGSWVDARIDLAMPDRKPIPRADVRRLLVALGPVVVFGSSNFPFAFSVAGGDTASALAAGCTVVMKAHSGHPGTAELVATAINRAIVTCGLPSATFSLIHGGGATIGVALVKHPATAAVGFTGSHFAGRALFDAAASRPHPIPVFAEMSSLNPLFVLPGAQRDRGVAIAEGVFASFTMGVGQFCTKPGLIFVTRGADTDVFLQKLAEAVRAAPHGTMLTRGIRDAFFENRAKVTGVTGVQLLASGSVTVNEACSESSPSVAITTAKNFIAHPTLATEAFGPFTLVVVGENNDELAACALALDGQLTATIHGNISDLAFAPSLIASLERIAGRVVINGFPTGVEVCAAMNHGGPYPATTDPRFTSVGTAAIFRFARPVCFQNYPDPMLPPALQNANPLGLLRLINGVPTRDKISG